MLIRESVAKIIDTVTTEKEEEAKPQFTVSKNNNKEEREKVL